MVGYLYQCRIRGCGRSDSWRNRRPIRPGFSISRPRRCRDCRSKWLLARRNVHGRSTDGMSLWVADALRRVSASKSRPERRRHTSAAVSAVTRDTRTHYRVDVTCGGRSFVKARDDFERPRRERRLRPAHGLPTAKGREVCPPPRRSNDVMKAVPARFTHSRLFPADSNSSRLQFARRAARSAVRRTRRVEFSGSLPNVSSNE
jgi:hypothetical protein